jgi:hypothetical protein
VPGGARYGGVRGGGEWDTDGEDLDDDSFEDEDEDLEGFGLPFAVGVKVPGAASSASAPVVTVVPRDGKPGYTLSQPSGAGGQGELPSGPDDDSRSLRGESRWLGRVIV